MGKERLEKTAGVNPVTWNIASGSLPAGLSLCSAGVVFGVPTTVAFSSFTPKVTDSAGSTATKTVCLAVDAFPDHDTVIDR